MSRFFHEVFKGSLEDFVFIHSTNLIPGVILMAIELALALDITSSALIHTQSPLLLDSPSTHSTPLRSLMSTFLPMG